MTRKFAEDLRKAYVSLISAESYLSRASCSAAATFDDRDRLKDAWNLADIAAGTCLRLLEEKDLLIESEPAEE